MLLTAAQIHEQFFQLPVVGNFAQKFTIAGYFRAVVGKKKTVVIAADRALALAFISQIVQDSPIERLHFRFHVLTKARTLHPAFVRLWIPD